MNKKLSKSAKSLIAIAATGAIIIGGFGIGVTQSPAFAATVSRQPVLSHIARVFTVTTIKEDMPTLKVNAEIPAVDGLSDEIFESSVNQAIKNKMTKVIEDSKKEHRKAIERAGSSNGFVDHIDVNYEVYGINHDILSFAVRKTSIHASEYYDEFFYNIDLKLNKEVMLKDLLGDNYIEKSNDAVKKEIERKSKTIAFHKGEESFKTISNNQSFYVNFKGNPVLVFNKYELAPGCAGIIEIEVER